MPAADISPATVIALLIEQQIVDTTDLITPESDLFACGMDSLAMMQLLLHLENDFAVRIAPEEMTRERFATAAALAAWLSGRIKTSA